MTDILAFKPVSIGPSKNDAESEEQRDGRSEQERIKHGLFSILSKSQDYPIEEDEMTISTLRNKIGKGDLLTREEDRLLHRLGDKAKEWRKQLRVRLKPNPQTLCPAS